jgi:CIC family chloride channel protein
LQAVQQTEQGELEVSLPLLIYRRNKRVSGCQHFKKGYIIDLPDNRFVLVGMAGMMAGVMHAPLTAIFLIAEMTGGYNLLIPLIITSTVAYITTRSFEKHSIYHVQLAKTGDLITHDKDKAVLTMMNWKNEIETDLLKG